MKKRLLG